ncbi:MAG: acylneuraminate cytidylyltransferase [Proteobacteria bacterium]|nr:acylneuraminate cytidylyltransferase [Pseudomonadota bacterium]
MAIIPARGGSRAILHKNLRLVAGKPLLAHSIEHALATPAIEHVFVSTDDPAIADTARSCGARIIDRPATLATDRCSSESALLHALGRIQADYDFDPTLIVFLQATSPLRPPHAIANAIAELQSQQADSLFSATSASGFMWRLEAGGPRALNYHPMRRLRRQDAPQDLIENGSIYLFRPWVLRTLGSRLGGKIAVYRMSVLDSFQVDEPEDLELIGLIAQQRRRRTPACDLARIRLLVLDFDGVMTDNRVIVDETGVEAVCCHRGDSLGISRVKNAGVEVIVLSTESSSVVAARCDKLRVQCVQGQNDKLSALQRLVSARGLEPDAVAYLGNDINDLACMQWVGTPIAVPGSVPEVISVAKLVTLSQGGQGAVREVSDWIVAAQETARRAA